MNWNNINEYRDTSGLGPIEYDQTKVPSLIRKHADNVRSKSYGQEVREAQARNAEYAGLIASEAVGISNATNDRQSNLENTFNSLQQEITDKDVISAPEIIAARGNEPTLSDRLDKDHQEVTAQLAQIAVNVKNFGATGDGLTDDTQALQEAVNFAADNGYQLLIPEGTYMVDAEVSVHLPSNTDLIMRNNTILKAIPNSNTHYYILKAQGVSNVTIKGGTILGERYDHFDSATNKKWKMWEPNTNYEIGELVYRYEKGYQVTTAGSSGTTFGTGSVEFSLYKESVGEWGRGIFFGGVNKGLIEGVTVKDCWGDGIAAVTNLDDGISKCYNITIRNVWSENNRRNNLTIGHSKNVLVTDSVFTKCNGTFPEAGIDIESDNTHTSENIVVENCRSDNNFGNGILVAFHGQHIILQSNETYGNKGYQVYIVGKTGSLLEDVSILNNHIHDSSNDGVYISDNVIDILVENNFIENNKIGTNVYNAENVTISHNKFSRNTERQLFVADGSGVTNPTLTKNIRVLFNDFLGVTSKESVYFYHTENIVFDGNTFGFYDNSKVYFGYSRHLSYARNRYMNMVNIVETNRGNLYDNWFSGDGTDFHLLLNENTKNIEIYNNVFMGSNYHGIAINAITVVDCKVFQNNFSAFSGSIKVLNKGLNCLTSTSLTNMWERNEAPTTGTWEKGQILFRTNPVEGGYIGWVCTASGTPGTWKAAGKIQT